MAGNPKLIPRVAEILELAKGGSSGGAKKGVLEGSGSLYIDLDPLPAGGLVLKKAFDCVRAESTSHYSEGAEEVGENHSHSE